MAKRKPFLLRIPEELHDELRAWAEREMRSLNGQIEFLLREAVRQRRRKSMPPEEPDEPGKPTMEA